MVANVLHFPEQIVGKVHLFGRGAPRVRPAVGTVRIPRGGEANLELLDPPKDLRPIFRDLVPGTMGMAQIDNAGPEQLRTMVAIPGLSCLGFEGDFSDDDLQPLADIGQEPLFSFGLSSTRISGAGLAALANLDPKFLALTGSFNQALWPALRHFGRLGSLNLWGHHFDERNLAHVSEAPSLDLVAWTGDHISAAAVGALAELPRHIGIALDSASLRNVSKQQASALCEGRPFVALRNDWQPVLAPDVVDALRAAHPETIIRAGYKD